MSRQHALMLLVCIALTACQSSDKIVNESSHGTLRGRVILHDTLGNVERGHVNALVTIDRAHRSTWTAEDGTWKLEGLTTGTYDITIEQAGYGRWRIFERMFAGNGTDYVEEIKLCKTPEIRLEFTGVVYDSSAGGVLHASLKPWYYGSSWIRSEYYIDRDSARQPHDSHDGYGALGMGGTIVYRNSEVKLKKGDTAYLSAALTSAYGMYYYAPPPRHSAFSSIGPKSNVLRFIWP